MIDTNTDKQKLRYRAYFWLMDASLISAVIGVIDESLDYFYGISMVHIPAPLNFMIGVPILFFMFVAPLFLLVAKFMRDEYTEQLFRRSLVVLAYAAGTVPFVIWLAAWFAFLVLDQATPGIFSFMEAKSAMHEYIINAWQVYLLAFVGIFQSLRWRDSR